LNWYRYPESWSFILRRYLPRLGFFSLVWEIVQLPLYTLWADSGAWQIAFAVVHCTVGDAMIGMAALVLSLILSRAGQPSAWPAVRIGVNVLIFTLAYTALSERVNLAQGNWSYSAWMPIVPWLEVGLSPMLQWVVVPFVTWRWANRRSSQLDEFN